MPPEIPKQLFFDKLPSEVAQKILSNLKPKRGDRESFYPFLHLAEASPIQRAEVLAALSHTLVITRRFEHLHRWAALFYPDIRELVITTGEGTAPDAVAHLLAAPNLRRLSMHAVPRFLRAVAHAPSLNTLRLNFFRPGAGAELLDLLPTLNLTDLQLTFCNRSNGCPLQAVSDIPQMLASCCPKVTKLHLDCPCGVLTADAEEDCLGWSVMASFPSLHAFEMDKYTAPSVPFVLDFASSWYVPPQLNQPLTSVNVILSNYSVVMEGHLAEDTVPTGQGSHLILVDTIPLLMPFVPSRLENICLQWDKGFKFSDDGTNLQAAYHEPYHGAILQMLSMAPEVKELHLMGVRIPSADMRCILASMGSKLEIFGTAIENQDELPDERLATVLEIASVENPSLNELHLEFESIEDCISSTNILEDCYEIESRRTRILWALNDIFFNNQHMRVVDFHSHEFWKIEDIVGLFFSMERRKSKLG